MTRRPSRDASVVVAAPTWHDVLPTVVLEALAAGRPVLGTELGGVPYLVGDAGWTVPADAGGAGRRPADRPRRAPRRGRAARLRYERTFHPDVVTKHLLDIYANLAQARDPS